MEQKEVIVQATPEVQTPAAPSPQKAPEIKNAAVGKTVIVKFFSNFHKENSSKLITKTLCKVGFISRKYSGDLPLNEEFWLCKIIDEVSPGQKRGCWMVEPIEKVSETDIQRLVPGFYDERLINGVLYITPHEKGKWILPLPLKKSISDCYAILVCL